MNVKEAIAQEQAIIDSAKFWVDGESTIGSPEELFIIAAHYDVRLPVCMRYFLYSESPNRVRATRYQNAILKVLHKLESKIKEDASYADKVE